MIAFREPHSVVLHFDECADAVVIDNAIARLSAHFAVGDYAHNARPCARRRPKEQHTRDSLCEVIHNVELVDEILTRVSPDLHLDAERDLHDDVDSVVVRSNDAWMADLAALLVRRDAPDLSPSFRAPHVVAALRAAFDRRLVEHRRVVSIDGVDVFLRAQTRLQTAFVDRLNRAVQRESAGRCALQLMPQWRGWSPELPDSVLLRLAVSAEIALIELSPRAGAQLAVTSTLVIEPAAAGARRRANHCEHFRRPHADVALCCVVVVIVIVVGLECRQTQAFEEAQERRRWRVCRKQRTHMYRSIAMKKTADEFQNWT
jgi:hypothetical protein